MYSNFIYLIPAIFLIFTIIGIAVLAQAETKTSFTVGNIMMTGGICCFILYVLPFIIAIPAIIFIVYNTTKRLKKYNENENNEKKDFITPIKENIKEENINNDINSSTIKENTVSLINNDAARGEFIVKKENNEKVNYQQDKKRKNLSIPILVCFFTIIIGIVIYNNYISKPEYIFNNGIKSNYTFNIDANKLAEVIDYTSEYSFENEINGHVIPKIHNFEYIDKNDEDNNYYKKIFEEDYDFKMSIVSDKDSDNIKNINISYDMLKIYKSDKTVDKTFNITYAYISIITNILYGDKNYDTEMFTDILNALNNNTKNIKYTNKGIPYGEYSYKNEKAKYKVVYDKNGNIKYSITPINSYD